MMIGAAAAAVIIVGIVAATMFRRTPPEPPPVTTTTTVPVTTSVPAPSGPTPEEQFVEHFNKAQELIAANDKAGAETENAEALKILPADPRGVQQQSAIAAMKPPAIAGATTTVPAPPKPTSSWTVTPAAGETASQRSNRENLARGHFEDGKKAFDDKRYAEAIMLLGAAIKVSGRDDFGPAPGDAANLLKQAQANSAAADAAAKRAAAQKTFEEGKALATSDLYGAVMKLRAARAADPQMPGVTELLNSLLDKAAVDGEAAFVSGKNFDAVNRYDDAIRQYERAVQLLGLIPGGHKNLQAAKDNLAELKAKR
jgi:tetratricopeptide (TPR) repeat protein